MRVTFHEKKCDAVMETTDWLMPPRVGDQVFLIGDARSDFDPATRCFQFDAVVEEVLFFGPSHAIVVVKQKPTAMSESIPDPTDQQEPTPTPPKRGYSCHICGLSTPHTMATLFKEIQLEKKLEEEATESSVADDAAENWRILTKAFNKHAVAASKIPLGDDDEDYEDVPLSEAEKSWGDGGGSPGECAPSKEGVTEASLRAEGLISSGIIKTVVFLHNNGFNICDSGDGMTYNSRDEDYPFVHMVIEPKKLVEESKRLFDLLTANDVKIEEFNPELDDGGPNIQASYDPANGIATLSLFNVKL